MSDNAHERMLELADAGRELVWFASAAPDGTLWSVVTDETFFRGQEELH